MVENAHKYGIMRMGIFGSVARGEQTEDSDVDVCVELQTPSMFCLDVYKRQVLFCWSGTGNGLRLECYKYETRGAWCNQ